MKRGEVWLCALDPTVGSEIRKTRPCLIVSPDELNTRLQTVVVVPMTMGSRLTRFRVPVQFGGKEGLLLPDQIRTVSRQRPIKLLGRLDDDVIAATLKVLADMFGP